MRNLRESIDLNLVPQPPEVMYHYAATFPREVKITKSFGC